jgi:hypothetical protein
MTLETWNKDETKAHLLAQLLAEPIMVEAFNVAVFSQLPRNMPLTDKMDATTALALAQSHAVGWHDCIRFIKGTLTKKPEPPKQQLTARTLDKSQ